MNQLNVVVPNAEIRNVRSRDGKRSFHVQRAGLVGEDGMAQRFEVWHDEKDTPYKPGNYTVDLARSVYIDKTGNMAIRPRLIPVAAPAKA